MSEENELFEGLIETFAQMNSEKTKAKYAEIMARWERLSEVIQHLPDLMDPGENWLELELEEIGIDIRAMAILGIRLAISKDVPPMEFASTYTSGYALGYLSALEDRGEAVFERLAREAPRIEEPEEEPGLAGFDLGVLKVETGPRGDAELDDLDALGEHLRGTSERIGGHFTEPDDDWAPVLIVVTEDEISLIGMEIGSEDQKDVLFKRIVPDAVKRVLGPAEMCAFVVSAWSLHADGPDDPRAEWLKNRKRGEQIKDHPDRVEELLLYLADKDGEAQLWLAPIEREPGEPPTLGEWRNDPRITKLSGRVGTMLQRILK